MDKLLLEVQRRVVSHSRDFVDEKTLNKYYLIDFLFNNGKVCTVSHAIQTLPHQIFKLKGSGMLTRENFDNLNERAKETIEREDAQK